MDPNLENNEVLFEDKKESTAESSVPSKTNKATKENSLFEIAKEDYRHAQRIKGEKFLVSCMNDITKITQQRNRLYNVIDSLLDEEERIREKMNKFNYTKQVLSGEDLIVLKA